jgi:opacity protein-like surface antigen
LWSAAGAGGIASLVAAAGLAAQGLEWHPGLGVGRALPVGNYHALATGQGFNAGWQAMGLVLVKPRGLPVVVRLDATYGTNSANDQLKTALTTAIGRPSDEQVKLVGVNLDLIYARRSSAPLNPYGLGGVGVSHVSITTTAGDSTTNTSGTEVAWNLGGGLSYRLASAALYLELRYVSAAAVARFPQTTVLGLTSGIRFGAP